MSPMIHGTYYDQPYQGTGSAIVDAMVEGMTNNALIVHTAVAQLVAVMAAEQRTRRINRAARRMVYGSLPFYRRIFVDRP